MIDAIEEIKQRVSILQLCSKEGIEVDSNNFIHSFNREDKNASLKIYPETNSFNDFGDNTGGSVIDFYMALYNVDKATAIKELKTLAGLDSNTLCSSFNVIMSSSQLADRKACTKSRSAIDIDKELVNKMVGCMSKEEKYLYDERLGMMGEDLTELLFPEIVAVRSVQLHRLEINKEIFTELWMYCLANFNKDERFRRYLLRDRMLSKYRIEISDLFFIGNYYQISNHLKKWVKERGMDLGDLQRSGLFNEKGNLIFYNHRIIIPYKYKNEIMYLRARYFDNEYSPETDTNKYLGLRNDAFNLNTPKRFYNIDVINNMFEGEHLYINEGEYDTLVMQDLGFNSIALPGVGNLPSERWFRRLLKFEIYLCFDQDEAGKKLESKIVNIFAKYNKSVIIKTISAKDPTELVKELVS